MAAPLNSDVAKRLTDLWEIEESERQKGIKLLQKVYGNILANPADPKFRDLNFSKIRKKLDRCRPAFYLLFTAGFAQSVDGQRLQWQNNKITIKQLTTASNALAAKIKGEDIDDGTEFGAITAPVSAQQKRAKERAAKSPSKNTSASPPKSEPAAPSAADAEDAPIDGANAGKVDGGGDAADDGDVEMNEEPAADDVAADLKEAGLDDDDLKLLEQIKAAKGITVTLKASDLENLTKEQKIVKFKEIQDQYRKEKKQNEVKAKLEKERRRRENVQKAQEAERKRKDYEMRMVAQRKKREKEEAKRRKKRITEKIEADKKRRAEQRARDKQRREAEKAAMLKAEQQQQEQ